MLTSTCSGLLAKQTLTVDHHLVGGFLGGDGVGELAHILSVVLLLQRVDHHGAHVAGEHQAAAGRQRLTVFQPLPGHHGARHRLAAEVRRAVAGDECSSRTADFNT